MWSEDFRHLRWHYDYIRLAWDTGFCFDKYKNPNLDKNKICIINVERIVKEKDVETVEKFIPIVIQYVLDNEQAQVLDENFVKMFRISQLSVEYLLFCKKYLDNTVVLLKKEISKLKEQNKELKEFTQDLETHVSVLTKLNSSISTFKCEKCLKVFSTQEFLTAHIKRRHSIESNTNININDNLETDKLESEIKVLKERLNSTEKQLIEKNDNDFKIVAKENETLKIIEMQEKFAEFKEQTEKDIKSLQNEKNFYEEKYTKLLEVVVKLNNENKHKIVDEDENQTRTYLKPVKSTMESMTQTEVKKPVKKLEIENITNKNTFDVKLKEKPELELVDTTFDESDKKQDSNEVDGKSTFFQEALENKIQSSVSQIETKMNEMFEKILKIENNRIEKEANSIVVENNVSQACNDKQDETKFNFKPKIKPRTKFNLPTNLLQNDNSIEAEKIKNELEKLKEKINKTCEKTRKVEVCKEDLEHVSPLIEYESNSRINIRTPKKKKTKTKIIKSKSNTNKIKIETSLRNENMENIYENVQKRLQELGISPNWKALPKKSFEKSMEIIDHQAQLAKKTYPNFQLIKKSVENAIKSETSKKPLKSPQKSKTKNVLRISCRKKAQNEDLTNVKPETSKSTITIKNRLLYETDSESESESFQKPSNSNASNLPAYSAVVQEFKKKSAVIQDTETYDSDLSSVFVGCSERDSHTKSVLKSYPSTGSLTKKKVFFDVEKGDSNKKLQGKAGIKNFFEERKYQKKNGDGMSNSDLDLTEN